MFTEPGIASNGHKLVQLKIEWKQTNSWLTNITNMQQLCMSISVQVCIVDLKWLEMKCDKYYCDKLKYKVSIAYDIRYIFIYTRLNIGQFSYRYDFWDQSSIIAADGCRLHLFFSLVPWIYFVRMLLWDLFLVITLSAYPNVIDWHYLTVPSLTISAWNWLQNSLCSSHITLPGPVRAAPGLFPGCFEQKSYVHSRGTYGLRAAPYEFCLPVRGPYSFDACIMSVRIPYGFRYGKQTVNSPCGDRKGPYGSLTAIYDDRVWFLQILVVTIPLRVRKSVIRSPCKSRTRPVRVAYDIKTLGIPVWVPYDARTGIVRGQNYSIKLYVYRGVKPSVSSRVLGCEDFFYFERWNSRTHPPI